MSVAENQQEAQTGSKAGRVYCLLAANVFSAASVWAAYLGTTRNPFAFILALGLAAGATLLFRCGRRGREAAEPLFATVILPILLGFVVLWEVWKASQGETIFRLAYSGTAIMCLILLLDLWFSRKKV